MSGRGGVRSSARLSGDAAAEAPLQRGRPPATSAAAAQRRARAAERAREVEDSAPVLRAKCRKLARALLNAKHLVVYTGAGISTAAAIPDYRGPAGVWTRLRRGEPVRRVEVSRARPTYTHMALSALWARGALKFVVSQNCDGLHVRAGLPRRALAELHGDMFVELCAPCRRVYLRAFDTTERTARHRHATRRLCHACGAELRDSIVHFGERGRAAWPLNWAGALRHAARADVVLCLGSSLKVLRRYPRLWRMHAPPRRRPQLYIVNLQWTPKDAVAALKINARCDAVMRLVARRLRLRVPRYRAARDPLLAHAEPLAAPEAHTTTRPLLRTDLLSDDSSSSDDSLTSDSLSSSSASDSDEELPLRRLADRLRARDSLASVTSPPPPPHGSPDRLRDSPSTSDRLHAFQVRLQSGDATVLLRAEHVTGPRRLTAALRSFRRVCVPRPPPARHGPEPQDGDKLAHTNGSLGLGSRLRRLLEYEPRIDAHDNGKIPPPEFLRRAQFGPNGARILPKREPKEETKTEPKDEPKAECRDEAKEEAREETSSSESSEGGEGAGGLAAAIIRRAVLVCRASLYPGLHSMVAPPAAAECAWCARYYRAARCLWYGAPRAPPPPARAWRRVRARRYLCACCPRDAAPPPHDTGGWYGKGYRKGRRR